MRTAKTIASLGFFVGLGCLAQVPYHNSLTWRANQWKSNLPPGAKFVAVAVSTNISAWSDDGTNWTIATMPRNIDWRGVAYGNGVFTAVGGGSTYASSTNKAAVSADGKIWTETTMPMVSPWQFVSFIGGKFISMGVTNAAVSTDGTNWTLVPGLDAGYLWKACGYIKGSFVAIASDASQNRACNSSDGINWAPSYAGMGAVGLWKMPASDGNQLVTVCYGTKVYANTLTGTNFSATAGMAQVANWYSIAYGSNSQRFVAVAGSPSACDYSTNANLWFASTAPAIASYLICHGNKLFIATGYDTNVCAQSYDGENWRYVSMPTRANWFGVCSSAPDRSP